jgi:hypothetical protein
MAVNRIAFVIMQIGSGGKVPDLSYPDTVLLGFLPSCRQIPLIISVLRREMLV